MKFILFFDIIFKWQIIPTENVSTSTNQNLKLKS